MKTKSTSEKPVKSRWILAVLGVCSLGSGYWMAVTIEDPVQALFLFFAAVVCVIIGTYTSVYFRLDGNPQQPAEKQVVLLISLAISFPFPQ